jgi:hypothetical protein
MIRLDKFLSEHGSWEETLPSSPERPSIWENIKRFLPSKDGITGCKPVMEREEGEANIISEAAYSTNPSEYLQNGFSITEEELIQRVKKWIEATSKLPKWAKITTCTFENRYYWPGWVLLENWEKGIMQQVHNRIPTQADWATFVIVKYTTADWKEWEKAFALLCMNWLVREYEKPWVEGTSTISVDEWKLNYKDKTSEESEATGTDYNFSDIENSWCLNKTMVAVWLATLVALWLNTCPHKPLTQDVEKKPKVIPQKSNIWDNGKEYIIPMWGSLIWTVWMTKEKAEKFAEDNWLKSYYTPDGKYIVIIQAWDVVIEWNNWEYQLLRKREAQQN